MRRKRVGVLFGGWSAERSISLLSGAAVCRALKRMKIPHATIDVTPRAADQVRRARIDAAFLAMHGPFGEDGCLQGLLDILGIPYTGSRVLASAVAMHKPTSKRIFESAGLATPPWISFMRNGNPLTLSQREREMCWELPRFPGPWVVKPASQGSAIGVRIVRKATEWRGALKEAFKLDEEILVEQMVAGREITVAVLGGRTLPVIEIVPKHAFYDFHSKYAKGGSEHIVPARLPAPVLEKASRLALDAFRAVGCRHFGRVDIMVPKSGKPTLLEINTLPGLTDTSLLPDAAKAAGLSFDDLILEILSLALAKKA
ncbi:MAG: D-alanine--D-alanine ligase [Elusimicrobia bacterium]|nr:D-alanine--D-alanine ligase [Elusimicrobiota bacterium]